LEYKYFLHKMNLGERTEEIPQYQKDLQKVGKVEQKFDRANSLFASWKEPDAKVYRNMVKEDNKKWKLKRFEKD
jgi:hypothetical protein